MTITSLDLPAAVLRQLAAAPHRLLFFVGATNVLLAMGVWTLWLVDARWRVFALSQPGVPTGWLHAIVMQYQVLPSFMFGFLLTVFPRWMNQSALTRRHYVPVAAGL
ncbi:MAG: NnrS family protein, partial [Steroidobacteraceae bacterium]